MKNKQPGFILLNIGLAEHYADWNYKNVHSPFARIYLVKEGNARLHLPGKTEHLTPGHLYFIPPFTLHSYECDNFFCLYYIHMYESPFQQERILEDWVYPSEIHSTPLDILLIEQLYKINPGRELKKYDPSDYDNSVTLLDNIKIHAQNPPFTTLETSGILYQLFSRFLKYASHKYEVTDNRIRKSLLFIRKHIDRNITVDELSNICYLSKDHFIRLFKKEMQITPIQYINQKKIEQAQLMMITGNQTIKDIAYSLSFDNISYFNRLFKKYTGVNPTQYKKE